MIKYGIYAVVAFAIFGVIGGYVATIKNNVEQAGINRQVAAVIAKSNQNIAKRRATDAQFDKFDAAAVCSEYGLTWVFEDGESHCE